MLTEADLTQFCASTIRYRHHWKKFFYTAGVKYLADCGKAYWLIDAIASYQDKRTDLVVFQLWELTTVDGSAVLTMRHDSDQAPIITQKIPYTDFPLEKVKLYVCHRVLMLPCEAP